MRRVNTAAGAKQQVEIAAAQPAAKEDKENVPLTSDDTASSSKAPLASASEPARVTRSRVARTALVKPRNPFAPTTKAKTAAAPTAPSSSAKASSNAGSSSVTKPKTAASTSKKAVPAPTPSSEDAAPSLGKRKSSLEDSDAQEAKVEDVPAPTKRSRVSARLSAAREASQPNDAVPSMQIDDTAVNASAPSKAGNLTAPIEAMTPAARAKRSLATANKKSLAGGLPSAMTPASTSRSFSQMLQGLKETGEGDQPDALTKLNTERNATTTPAAALVAGPSNHRKKAADATGVLLSSKRAETEQSEPVTVKPSTTPMSGLESLRHRIEKLQGSGAPTQAREPVASVVKPAEIMPQVKNATSASTLSAPAPPSPSKNLAAQVAAQKEFVATNADPVPAPALKAPSPPAQPAVETKSSSSAPPARVDRATPPAAAATPSAPESPKRQEAASSRLPRASPFKTSSSTRSPGKSQAVGWTLGKVKNMFFGSSSSSKAQASVPAPMPSRVPSSAAGAPLATHPAAQAFQKALGTGNPVRPAQQPAPAPVASKPAPAAQPAAASASRPAPTRPAPARAGAPAATTAAPPAMKKPVSTVARAPEARTQPQMPVKKPTAPATAPTVARPAAVPARPAVRPAAARPGPNTAKPALPSSTSSIRLGAPTSRVPGPSTAAARPPGSFLAGVRPPPQQAPSKSENLRNLEQVLKAAAGPSKPAPSRPASSAAAAPPRSAGTAAPQPIHFGRSGMQPSSATKPTVVPRQSPDPRADVRDEDIELPDIASE